jgi:hypothetical protein
MTEETVKIKQPPLLFSSTQKILGAIREKIDGVFITYWNNPGGSVCHNDVIAIYNMLENIGKHDTLYMFIKSDGGSGQASVRIVNLLRQYFKAIYALVPLQCASAATMIALGANEIHMGPMSYLTAIDTSLTHDLSPIDRDNERVSVSLDELKRVIRLWQKERDDTSSNPYKSLFEYVHPLVIGAVDRADSLSVMLCKQILSYHIEQRSRVEEIAETLNSRFPSHSFPILASEAEKFGLNIKPLDHDIHALLLELNHVYSAMGQKSTTDLDEIHSHTNEILNIIETNGLQLYYQMDKDWFYRAEERRWVAMNDLSGWRKVAFVDGKVKRSKFHIA